MLKFFAVSCLSVVLRQLTSDELALEWDRVENSKAFLGANCETILVLVEAHILYAFWAWCFVYHFTNNYYNLNNSF